MSFPRYAAYKDSGVEWLGKVPEYWEVTRLRYASYINPSKSELNNTSKDSVISFLPMESIGEDGRLCLDRTKRLEEVEAGYTYFRDGDVVVAKITPCFENGKGALISGLLGGVGFGTTELIVARPLEGVIHPRLLDYIFRSHTFRLLGESSMYGAGGQKRVPESFVKDFTVALPSPFTEQESISSFLDYETAKIDALIVEQQRLIELLQEKRQAVISHSVTKGLNPDAPMKDSGVEWLGDVPVHWEVLKISKVTIKITNGYVGPTRDILIGEGVPYIQATHIKKGRVNFDFKYFVSPEWSTKHSKSILAEGDVLVVQTGAGTGDVGLVSTNEIGFNCHALIILAPDNSKVFGAYLSAVLQSSYGQQSLESIQTGGMHPHLNCGNVKFVEVPIPPLVEQEKILEDAINLTSTFEGLSQDAESAVSILQERRSALISAAVTGQIDVRGLVPEAVAA
jgi:type I restriction enzyme S subunit